MTSPAPHYPDHDTVFTWAAPPLRIGLGAVEEVAFELARFAPRRVLLITDGQLMETGWPGRVARLIQTAGMHCQVYDGVHVEPTDRARTATPDRPSRCRCGSSAAPRRRAGMTPM